MQLLPFYLKALANLWIKEKPFANTKTVLEVITFT